MRWWANGGKQSGMELDVVADSTDGKFLLVGECKWSEKTFNIKELVSEVEKKSATLPFAGGKTVIPVLFLKQHKEKIQNSRVLFPLDVLSLLRKILKN